ncbi:hypothetical protein ABB27_07170 [Stenotrophomonas terrae]|uniref:Teneurin NHL domain-containing protein n=1 Tax=Stenotrophomonas terrae TaxID=405446 RepID=A0A0R0CHP7_9GAMM|nr:hypothetical protein [Stenotrophomonas terrae]KRG68678.1 hypothetical protein ABB27_07170 [Stenotrophomonas terrae]
MDALNMTMLRWPTMAVLGLAMTVTAHASQRPVLEWEMGDPGSSGNSDGVATEARFVGPLELYRDKDGALLIVDTGDDAVRRLGQDGVVTTLVGSRIAQIGEEGEAESTLLAQPSELLRLQDGRLLVIQKRKGMQALDARGVSKPLQLKIGAPFEEKSSSGNSAMEGVVVAPSPPSFPSLQSREQARAVEPEVRAEDSLPEPKGMALDAKGRIWIADGGGFRERTLVIDTQGAVHHWAPGQMIMLRRIATGADGKLWGINNNKVFRLYDDRAEVVGTVVVPEWTPPADYLVSAPRAGAVAALIGQVPFAGRAALPPMPTRPKQSEPADLRGLAVDPQGRPLLIDRHRLMRLDPRSGEFTTLFELPPREDDRGYGENHISSLAVDGKGRTLLTINGDGAIFALAADGKLALVAGHAAPTPWWRGADTHRRTSAALPARLDDSIVMLPDGGTLYVAKLDNALIHIDREGVPALWAGSDGEGRQDGPRLEARFNSPSDLARAQDGTVYIADSGNARIRKVSADGRVETLAGQYSDPAREDGGFDRAGFWEPVHIALDEERNALYVMDETPYVGTGEVRLRRLDLKTRQVSTLSSDAYRPMHVIGQSGELELITESRRTLAYKDIAVGPGGQLYALAEDEVWRIDPVSGLHRLVFVVGPRPAMDAHEQAYAQAKSSAEREALLRARCNWVWCRPERMEVDAQGNVYLSDKGSNTVVRIGADGKAGVIAGVPGQLGNKPGALPGGLDKPGGLAFSAEGDLLINVNEAGVMRLRNPAQAPFSVAVPTVGTSPLAQPL